MTNPENPRTTEYALCRDAQGKLSLRGIVPVGSKVCLCRLPIDSAALERIAREWEIIAPRDGMTQVDEEFVRTAIAFAIGETQDEITSGMDRLKALLRCTSLLRRAA